MHWDNSRHTKRDRWEEIVLRKSGESMIKCLEIMLGAWSREVWKNRLVRVIRDEKINSLKLKVCIIPEERSWGEYLMKSLNLKKHIEAEMIRCFELALYQSHKRRTMKQGFTADSISLSCSLTLSFTPPFHTFHNIRKRKEADYIFIYKRCCCLFILVYNNPNKRQ